MTEQDVNLSGIRGIKILPLASFPSLTFSQKIRISVGHVTFTNRELKGFISSKYFMATETAKVSHVLQAGKIL
jgi:hypothetical protein